MEQTVSVEPSSFSQAADFVLNYDAQAIASLPNFYVFWNRPENADYFNNFSSYWNEIRLNVRLLRENFGFLSSNDILIKTHIDAFGVLFQDVLNNPLSFPVYILSIKMHLEILVEHIQYLPNFINTLHSDADHLDDYINIGQLIRSDESYPNSVVGKLENVLEDTLNGVESNISDANRPVLTQNDVKKSFIALVSPSFTGKTQTAFVFNSIKPLYFVRPEPGEFNRQRIYLNFNSLNLKLKQVAFADLLRIKHRLSSNVQAMIPNFVEADPLEEDLPRIYQEISSSNLKSKHSSVKLYSLGFLVALCREARQHLVQNPNVNWMRYWATQRGFSFVPLSFDDLNNPDLNFTGFGGFCLFLDEFVGNLHYVLVRNIARVVGLSSVLSNTNSDITNLVGKLQSLASSDVNQSPVWSIVLTELDCIPRDVFDQVYLGRWNSFFDNAILRCTDPNALNMFKEDFLTNQMRILRPGILNSFIEALLAFQTNTTGSFTFCQFFDEVMRYLGNSISTRKRRIIGDSSGQMANLSLHLGNAYNSAPTAQTATEFSNVKEFLRDHLFFLNNPVDANEIMFLTFPTSNPRLKNLYIFDQLRRNLQPWRQAFTQMNEGELLTILGCLAIEIDASISECMMNGRNSLSLEGGALDISSASNIDAVKRDGNYLEVLTTITTLDASHHSFNNASITFKGQCGTEFIKTFTRNLIDESGSQRIALDTWSVDFVDQNSVHIFDLETFLRNSWVPFLMPSNLEIPNILMDLNNLGAIQVGKCRRMQDRDEVNISFDFYADTNLLAPTRLRAQHLSCVIECKNQIKILYYSNLNSICKKALQRRASLSLITCLHVSHSRTAPLSFYSSLRGVNIFLLKKITATSFHFVQFPDTVICDRPRMVCLVFEIKNLNPDNFLVRSFQSVKGSRS